MRFEACIETAWEFKQIVSFEETTSKRIEKVIIRPWWLFDYEEYNQENENEIENYSILLWD